jgi:hypothetical protein
MLNIMDFFTGRVVSTKPDPEFRRPPCTPDLPKDPEPVRPPEPFCTTGPDFGKLGKLLQRRSKKKKRR